MSALPTFEDKAGKKAFEAQTVRSSVLPLQCNLNEFVNNPLLSDVVFKCRSSLVDKKQRKTDVDDESEIKSLDLDDNDSDDDGIGGEGLDMDAKNIVFAHWDILRARCALFNTIYNHFIADMSAHSSSDTRVGSSSSSSSSSSSDCPSKTTLNPYFEASYLVEHITDDSINNIEVDCLETVKTTKLRASIVSDTDKAEILDAMISDRVYQKMGSSESVMEFHQSAMVVCIEIDLCYEGLLCLLRYLYTGECNNTQELREVKTSKDTSRIVEDLVQISQCLYLADFKRELHYLFHAKSRRLFREYGFSLQCSEDERSYISLCNSPVVSFSTEKGIIKNEELKAQMDWFFDSPNFCQTKPNLMMEESSSKRKRKKRKNEMFFNTRVLFEGPSMFRISSNDGHSLKASRVLLAAMSGYFHTLFCSASWAESSAREISLPLVNTGTLILLRDFCCRFDGRIFVEFDLETCLSMLEWSDYFLCEDLRLCLLDLMSQKHISIDTLPFVWELSYKRDNLKLKDSCIKFAQTNISNVLTHDKCYMFTEDMIYDCLKDGLVKMSTSVLLSLVTQWADRVKGRYPNVHRKHIDVARLLPPNTLFNSSHKNFLTHGYQLTGLDYALRYG